MGGVIRGVITQRRESSRVERYPREGLLKSGVLVGVNSGRGSKGGIT